MRRVIQAPPFMPPQGFPGFPQMPPQMPYIAPQTQGVPTGQGMPFPGFAGQPFPMQAPLGAPTFPMQAPMTAPPFPMQAPVGAGAAFGLGQPPGGWPGLAGQGLSGIPFAPASLATEAPVSQTSNRGWTVGKEEGK